MNREMKDLHTCKYVLTQIDNFGRLAYTTPRQVEKPVEDIRMTIMEPNPAQEKGGSEKREKGCRTLQERNEHALTSSISQLAHKTAKMIRLKFLEDNNRKRNQK